MYPSMTRIKEALELFAVFVVVIVHLIWKDIRRWK